MKLGTKLFLSLLGAALIITLAYQGYLLFHFRLHSDYKALLTAGGEFEAGASLTISQKDMRISALETENEKQAGKIRVFLAAAIAAGAAAFLFICLKFFRSTKALGGLWK